MSDNRANDAKRVQPLREHKEVTPPPAETVDFDHLDRFADALDSRFRIPGTQIRFGYDSLLGFIPGVGDIATLGPAVYLIWQGRKAGASNFVLTRMAANAGVDFVIGSIPLIGDIFDVGFKSNRRNVELLKRALAPKNQTGGTATDSEKGV